MSDVTLPGFWGEMGVLTSTEEAELSTYPQARQAEIRSMVAEQRRIAEDGHAVAGRVLATVTETVSRLEEDLLGRGSGGLDESLTDVMYSAVIAVESVRALHEGVGEGQMWSVERISGEGT